MYSSGICCKATDLGHDEAAVHLVQKHGELGGHILWQVQAILIASNRAHLVATSFRAFEPTRYVVEREQPPCNLESEF